MSTRRLPHQQKHHRGGDRLPAEPPREIFSLIETGLIADVVEHGNQLTTGLLSFLPQSPHRRPILCLTADYDLVRALHMEADKWEARRQNEPAPPVIDTLAAVLRSSRTPGPASRWREVKALLL
jgi:hypothetical protein